MVDIKERRQVRVRSFATLVRRDRPLTKRQVIRIRHGAIEVQFARQLKWD
jgi:hypothetical protein